jgi:hypothetical protein
MRNDMKNTYSFLTLELTFIGLGVPFLSDKAKEIIANMPIEHAKAINKEAWRQRKQANRIANRHCNWSQSGNISTYENAAQHSMVAEEVCKETYKRMLKG